MIIQHTPSLRYQAHLAYPQGLPSVQKCQKSLPAHPALPHRLKKLHQKAIKHIDNQLYNKNGQLVTACIVHLADSADFEGVTFNKRCYGLIGSCFESPNDTIHVTVLAVIVTGKQQQQDGCFLSFEGKLFNNRIDNF